jgi:hypothetical protein
MTGTLHEDLSILTIISRAVLLRMRNISDKFVEEIKTHFVCKNICPKLRRLRDIGEKHRTARQAMDYNIIWLMRIA